MSNIYLAGPMTGLPDLNYPAFHDAAAALRAQGHRVYNPADWETYGVPREEVKEFTIRRAFDLHLAFIDYTEYIIRDADMVVALPGWSQSPGATAEMALARAIKVPVMLFEDRVILEVSSAPECEGHREQQHRDRKPPWCSRCGWTRGQPAKPAQKLGTSIAERDAASEGHVPWSPTVQPFSQGEPE